MGTTSLWWVLILYVVFTRSSWDNVAHGLGCNWGSRVSHPLPANIVVKMLKENGFDKVKLFEAEAEALKALGNSDIQVMVGIPNDMLAGMASSVQTAVNWVSANVSAYISKYGTDIRYVAVGNEPFLKTYNGSFLQVTFPALQNVQAALIKAGLGRQVKVTVPLNADVYQSDTGLPSGGNFRADIIDLMLSIIKFLSDNGAPLTINIYPFLSLYADPNFPIDYAFFSNGSAAAPPAVVDGSISYTNVLDANFDTLISALEKNGFGSMPVIVGEVGWPTDGNTNANVENARRFNQGLMNRVISGQGTPKRPAQPDIYLFALIDEDMKSIDPGSFERHWGLFYYDGTVKYQLDMGGGRALVAARGVKYKARQWCVMAPQASLSDPSLPGSVAYACTYADCTSLGYESSCSRLDARSNVSYAFNMYYQTMDQRQGSCSFNGLSAVTTIDPSEEGCRFEIMIDTGNHEGAAPSPKASSSRGTKFNMGLAFVVVLALMVWS
ncbi:hypothetical protein SAY86_001769 [Trapa natans]|uniref:glucan endo-1,3-beta-D-glucosidase n=1 Tax=Trapa natans TaxID=22666 RepID=A0AAN7LPI0_TRANT|nr:hypothetical protein SAY86_001769 [Trapa natans]